MLSPLIRKQIEAKFGQPIRYSKDCNNLASQISASCKCRVSASTLKRLLGFVKGLKEPRSFTLDVIAEYLDCNSWDELLEKSYNRKPIEKPVIEKLSHSQIRKGEQIQIGYAPNRLLTLKYLGKEYFEVVESTDNKLIAGERIRASTFILSHPLFIPERVQGSRSLLAYTAGKISGLTFIRKV
jgi:hypothetical protein